LILASVRDACIDEDAIVEPGLGAGFAAAVALGKPVVVARLIPQYFAQLGDPDAAGAVGVPWRPSIQLPHLGGDNLVVEDVL
jgi:hypothetical protein